MGVVSGKPNRIPDPSHIWESDFVPSGVMFNPKTSEISSHRFIGSTARTISCSRQTEVLNP